MTKSLINTQPVSPLKWREVVLAALLLVALLLPFFGPATFAGRALLPTDLIYQLDPLWQPLAPDGFIFPGNQLLIDQVYQFYPWKLFAVRSLAAGRLPLWNPYINGGQPFLANGQSALLSPFNALSYLAPLPASFTIAVLLRLFTAGIFTYLLAREIGTSKSGAVIAMLAFAFGGPILVWIGYAIGNVAVWLPAALFFSERMLTRRSWGDAIAATVVAGLQFLGGQPEMSFHLMLLWLAYCLYRIAARHGRRPSQWLELGLKLVIVAIGGLSLAAVALLPFFDFVTRSEVLGARAGSQPSLLHTLLLDWHDWPSAVLAVLPRFMGTPVNGSYWYPYGNYNDYALYVGVLPLALAIVAVVMACQRRQRAVIKSSTASIAFFAVTAAVALAISLHWPVFNLLNRLPIFNLILNGRFLRSVYALAMAILAGVGLDQVRIALTQPGPSTANGVNGLKLLTLTTGFIAVTSLLVIAASYTGIVVLQDKIISLGRSQVEAMQGHVLFPHSLEYYYGQVEAMYHKMLGLFEPRDCVMYLPVLVNLCVLWLYRQSRRSPAGRTDVAAVALLIITSLDLFVVHGDYNPTIAPEQVFPSVSAVRLLQEAGKEGVFRVTGVNLALMPNSSMVFGLSDVRGYDAVAPKRYMEVMGLVEGSVRLNHYSLLQRVDDPLLDLLNVVYALSDKPLDGKWELVYAGEPGSGDVKVYRNHDALPRAFVVHQAEVVSDAVQSLARMNDDDFDYHTTVLLEGDEQELTAGLNLTPNSSASDAIITHYEPDRAEVTSHTTSDGFLVLSDGYDPGWQAELDDRPVKIYIANHAFRAVALPAGEHRVTFTYDPTALKIGLGVSLLAWTSVAGASVWLILARRRE